MTVEVGDRNYESILREGITAARGGRFEYARRMLFQATRINPYDARAWVWLSETTDDIEERQGYLEKALAADPSNATARRGLALINGMLAQEDLLPEGEGVAAQNHAEPLDATGQVYQCPNCGGRMQYDPENETLACEYCDYQSTDENENHHDDQVVDLVLPTAKGHRWAEASHLLSCQRCGAQTLMDVGEKSTACAYCGSHQVIESVETQDLIEPQAIGLMKVQEEDIPGLITPWLKQGWYTPDDLSRSKQRLTFRPGYYPFWSFNGILAARWSCEIREGANQTAHWVPKTGTEVLMFDDLLILGVNSIPGHLIEDLKPFNMEELEAFIPDHLAGWPALAYDRSMADASLLARETFVKEARQTVAHRVHLGNERRDFKVGGGKWSGMTFKLVLLPLWVGTYHYKGKDFPFFINGQTGQVAGDKPQDDFKKYLIWASGLGTALLIAFVALIILLFLTQ